jgi:signal transduction histidine kinase
VITILGEMSSYDSTFDHNNLFADVPPELMPALMEFVQIVSYKPDEIIFQEGDTADCMYLIGRGAVRISKRGRGGHQETLVHLEPGDFFGEMSLYDPAPRSTQAAAAQETSLGQINRAGLQAMLQIAPSELTRNLIITGVRRLRRADSQWIDRVLRIERLSMIGAVVNDVVHDLKGPLNIFIGAAENLIERSNDPAAVEKFARMIIKAAYNLDAMVRDVLDYSRGEMKFEFGRSTVRQLMDEVNDQIRVAASSGNVVVSYNLNYDGEIVVDKARFERALLNLARNAIDAMPKGGKLDFTVDQEAERIRFTIADNGPGIPNEILPTIFEPFVTHNKRGGTGLGLAITRSIVEAHNGTISVGSVIGEGTTFVIRIPRGVKTE